MIEKATARLLREISNNAIPANDLKAAISLANKSCRIQMLEWSIEDSINKLLGKRLNGHCKTY